MPTFTEKLILMLFSTDWHTRELALKTIKDDLGSNRLGSSDPEELFVGVFTVASKTGYDKIAQVALETMSLIQTTCTSAFPSLNAKGHPELGKNLDKTLGAMMEKIGDNNARLRERTEEAALCMAGHPSIGVGPVLGAALAKPNAKKPSANSVKHIHGKLALIKKIIESFEVPNWRDCVKNALQYVSHQAGEIRNGAYGIVLELYVQLGRQVITELDSIRPNQRELLDKAFSLIDEGNAIEAFQLIGMNYSGKNTSRQTESIKGSTNRSHKAACHFCKLQDPSFSNEDNLNMHLANNCKFLTACEHCDQVIEISGLRDHQLEECEKKSELKQCPRCKQAIHSSIFDDHVA